MHSDPGKKKIGIMGGTFDPIHNGHLHIAECARKEYGLSEIWFIPAGDPYFKAGKAVTPPETRLRMTELAVASQPYFRCSDIELRKSGPTYTAETMEALQKLYPEHSFYFIIGADSLFQLECWHTPERLFRSTVILCAGRPDENVLTNKEPNGGSDTELNSEISRLNRKFRAIDCDIRRLHCRPVGISSTMIRKAVSEGRKIANLVPGPVAEYIMQNGLYLGHPGQGYCGS